MFELFDISKEEQENILNQARRVLSSYRQLKKAYTLSIPQVHTQHFGGVSTSKSARTSNESPELIRYLELGEKVEKIEQAVSVVENSEYIKNRYMIVDRLQQWRLAELIGVSMRVYNRNLRTSLIEFAVAYGIVDFSKYDFKVETVSVSHS
ncbi:MAG: hypothetical protein L0F95_00830 [Lactococcus sp.]|uniref:Phage transcriptional activator n=1 Tax=Pseudolactococcus piscium MKFS47 TaxID=297352 RepID=A0A0D6DXL5_9LACT|nr:MULTISPECIES: hypothetical protein [Lactococcus]MCJ1971568.1 hypothetical protein [Lactococcus carnosus]MDN5410936.1 hypothetical protein [Lactococcus sp.]MDN5436325.1 hypothetical protein [Lactococcus sp.]MDN5461046.1 hypothetical protein [Lactococcus sp.]MDN5465151.1 hypothetical protein [Lactococcus sp.]